MYLKTNNKLLPLETQPAASIFALSIRNIQRPGVPTLELFGSSSTCRVRDPGILKYRTPSPALKPACLRKINHLISHLLPEAVFVHVGFLCKKYNGKEFL